MAMTIFDPEGLWIANLWHYRIAAAMMDPTTLIGWECDTSYFFTCRKRHGTHEMFFLQLLSPCSNIAEVNEPENSSKLRKTPTDSDSTL
jgi:hypothetical protein